MDVQVAILPALFGTIEVRRVVLRSPAVRVIRTAKGLSIDGLGGGGAAKEPGSDGEGESLAGEGRRLLLSGA